LNGVGCGYLFANMYGSLDGFLFPDIEKSIAVAYEFG
jgi:hypothetical protein